MFLGQTTQFSSQKHETTHFKKYCLWELPTECVCELEKSACHATAMWHKRKNEWDLKEAMDFLSFSWDSSVTFLSSSEWDPGLLHVSKDWLLIQTACLSAWSVFYLSPSRPQKLTPGFVTQQSQMFHPWWWLHWATLNRTGGRRKKQCFDTIRQS